MTRAAGRAGRVAVAAGIAVAAVPLAAAPAQAAPCSGSSGVTVVVDFGPLGGIRTSCAAGDPSSGLAALHAAGFSTTGTQQFGNAYVCRISGLPAPQQEPCVRTPPTTAYWAYFHAARGGSWTYSSGGAGTYNPAPGTVEGWRFGSGAAPGIAPPAASAPPPPAPRPTTQPPPPPPRAPAPTTRATTAAPAPGPAAPGTRGRTSTTSPRPGATSSPSSPASPARPATTAPATPTSAAPGTTTDPATPGGTTDGPAEPPVTATDPASSSRGLTASLIGAALVAALALAAFLIVRRRRTAPPT